MADDRRTGDWGQTYTIGVTGLDLMTVDVIEVLVKKPDGSHVTWAPTTHSSLSIDYVFKPGDLDLAGVYQGHVQLTKNTPTTRYVSTPFFLNVATVA